MGSRKKRNENSKELKLKLMLSEALVAVISAMFFLGELLSFAQWIGVLVILSAGVIVALTDDVSETAEA